MSLMNSLPSSDGEENHLDDDGIGTTLEPDIEKTEELWTYRTGLEEKVVDPYHFQDMVYEQLALVRDGIAEFLVAAPSKPVNGFEFIQAVEMPGGRLHVEVGTRDERNELTILCKNGLSILEAADLFVTLYHIHSIFLDGWKKMTFQ